MIAPSAASPARVRVDGKCFRLGPGKFFIKGLTYGPFAPNQENEMFSSREQTACDFKQIRQLGANVLRVYYMPPKWFLDLAAEHELKILIDVPWPKHLCFLDSRTSQENARAAVRQAVRQGKNHPAVLAYSVVNEISAEIARWSGVRKVETFIDQLIDDAKAVDPDCLCTFASFPPTEFLRPEKIDFVCFNVYLHKRRSYESYLARLQVMADAKPLLLGEFGIDSLREGEGPKCEILEWQIESAFRSGLAGTVLFSYTDDWFRGGMQIEDWGFGLTDRNRQPKDSFRLVHQKYRAAPYFPLARNPKVSVVVASYNGGRTLAVCLDSLTHLNYPDYEVILVDDGSTDATAEIASQYPTVRYIHQSNQGLSAARNAGIAAATGEIVAFTDSDCRADEDWLYYLAGDLLSGDFVGIGGHNFLPPEDSAVAAAVAVSPGGPAHVMLTDREAEHIPGCNMAFYKWVLDDIGGFDHAFHKAGDDVDVCWRLQDRGYKIGFSAASFVWHYRRSTVKAYLKQQAGYGEAEALLSRKHPDHFNSLGGGLWRGRIYGAAQAGIILLRPIIYHGLFGSGLFQRLYAPNPALPLMLCTTLGCQTFINLPLLLLSVYFDFLWPLALASLAMSLGVCIVAAAQAPVPKHKHRFWSRPLIGWLFFLQPLVRGWARFKWRLIAQPQSNGAPAPFDASRLWDHDESAETICYWSKGGVDRYAFLSGLLARLERLPWQTKLDSGWSNYDLEIFGHPWSRLLLITATEELEQGKRSFRCRCQSMWSLRAWIVFWAGLGAELILISYLAPITPWIWMFLLAAPLLLWHLEEERQWLRLTVEESLDEAASQLQLVKLC